MPHLGSLPGVGPCGELREARPLPPAHAARPQIRTVAHRWIAVCLVIVGCSTTSSGEVTYATCTDGDDDDADLLVDCGDPDCQAFDHCTLLGTSPEAGPARDAGGDSDSAPPPPDGGAIDEDAGLDEDAGAGDAAGPDAGAMPCGGSCGPTQVCIDEQCQAPAPTMGRFAVTLVSVGVPDKDGISRCFDDTCEGLPSPPFGFCTCPPDPYVWMVHVREGVQTTVGRTATAIDERMPDFSDMPMLVELAPGDVLRVSLMDQDPTIDQLMYRCELSELPSTGRARCSEVILGVEYAIEVELMFAPTGTGN